MKATPEPSLIGGRQRGVAFRLALASVLSAVFLGSLGACPANAAIDILTFDGQVVADKSGNPYTQAGGHPYAASTIFRLDQAGDYVKDIVVDLPLGFAGDPTAAPTCTANDFLAGLPANGGDGSIPCPRSTQVGIAQPVEAIPAAAVYNLKPPPGITAMFAFGPAGAAPVFLEATVRPDDYGVSVRARGIIHSSGPLLGTEVTLWGVPADPVHDYQRCATLLPGTPIADGGPLSCLPGSGFPPFEPGPAETEVRPFLTLPTRCTPDGEGLITTMTATSYQGFTDIATFESHNPPGYSYFGPDGFFIPQEDRLSDPSQWGPPQGPTGCDQVPFTPEIEVDPSSQAADSPTALDVDISFPTDGLENPTGISQSHLKQAVVTLPEGMSVSPSAADGLGSCSEAEVGISHAGVPNGDPVSCPDDSKIGTVEIETPLLDETLEGSVYLAEQDQNPFDSTLALYLTAANAERGILVKLPGQVSPDPQTGQLKASFDNNPQLPFSRLGVHFFGGPRASLVTPPTCGDYETSSELRGWANPDEPVELTDDYAVTTGPGGSPCPDLTDPARFTPGFQAGTLGQLAGSSSPFVLKVTRPDGQQNLKQLSVDLPPGLVAKLAGIPRCDQDQITPTSTSCPAGSQVGVVNVGAGPGSTPFFLTDQPVYLTEGYGGAPLGLAIDTHAIAGPLDLGHVVVRSQLFVDQDDAQVHVVSEQIPHILEGIPLKIRSVAVNINRPGFIQAPTNCNPLQVTGTVTGGGADLSDPSDDTIKAVSQHFQVSGCGGLGFSPKLSGQILNGQDGIHRSDHPNLLFDLKGTPGDANLSRVEVLLPQNFQIDQANLGNICSETQLATQDCAGRQRIGTASAITPLLDTPLSGPVYAVSGSGGLPKLALILHGPPELPIKLVVRGITETVGARIKNTFPLVPDAPVSSFALNLDGGPQGYLVNNTDLCGSASKGKAKKKKGKKRSFEASAAKKGKKKKSRRRPTGIAADATFFGQNGDILSQSVPISADCGTAKKNKGKK